MVKRDRDVAHTANDDVAIAHDGAILDSMDAENRDLGMVDQWRDEQSRRPAGARDGERAAAQLLRRELPGVSRVGEPVDVRIELFE